MREIETRDKRKNGNERYSEKEKCGRIKGRNEE